jgi:gluconate 5-dehydrogenase
VITGGSSGFGFAMAKTLLSHGAVVAIAARGGIKLDQAYAELKAKGFDVHKLEMDVRNEASAAAAAGWAATNWDRLDMLVNNAGIGMGAINKGERGAPTPFYEIQVEDFMDVVNTNFIGYFLVARAFVPLMLRHGGGRVVNVSTSIRTMTARGQLPYGPARAGAEAMSVILADELKDRNIMVNVLLPGGASNTGFVPEGQRANAESRGLLPASVMNEAILFLASEEAAGLTGERIIAKDFRQWHEEKYGRSDRIDSAPS